jgi:hypothetical protein
MNFEKENFLRTKLIPHLQQLDPSTPPKWGKLSVQGMIEHFAHDAVRNASGKLRFEKTVTPEEHLQRMRDFMLSDKPFRPNTKNPLMQEEPIPLHYKTVQAAINSLQEELIDFFSAYEKEPSMTIVNPFFGTMNFDQNVQLLYKHALHHLNQFGVEPPNT